MKTPRTVWGTILLAVLVTAGALAVLAGAGALITSRWMFTDAHAAIWICGVGAMNAVIVMVMAARKAREDRRALAPRTPPPTPIVGTLAGPGGVYRRRRR
jgi:hypothetical protein